MTRAPSEREPARIAWEEVRDEFRFDGAWIDLYAFEVGPVQWDRMFRALEGVGYRLLLGESKAAVVVDFSEMQRVRERTGSAIVDLMIADEILLQAFLYDPERIEITVDPRKVSNADAYARLCSVVELIGAAVGRTVTLCPENGHWLPFLSYSPSEDVWTRLQPDFSVTPVY